MALESNSLPSYRLCTRPHSDRLNDDGDGNGDSDGD
jgi:hypothetical protein